MTDLVTSLRDETGFPWRQHVSRSGAAVLFFGRPIPEGTCTVASHALVVFGEPAHWHVDVLRYGGPGENRRALRVPGDLDWLRLLEFVELLVPRLGGVSPLYQPVQS